MVAPPPSAALETKAPQTPGERMAALAMRSDNPIKRTIDVMCVILLQLLILIVMVDEKDLEKRRSCYVLAPDSILTRLEQGFDFGLPAPIVASIRLAVRLLRAEYNLGQDYIDWLIAPEPLAPIRRPSRRSRGRGLRRADHGPRRPPIRQSPPVARRLPPVTHHPPARPPPVQKPAIPASPTHAFFVTISNRSPPAY